MEEAKTGSNGKGQDKSPAVAAAQAFFAHPELICLALEAGKIGMWALDIASSRIVVSCNVEEIHGLPAGTFDGSQATFENAIHPDDRPNVRASIAETFQTHKPRRVQYRLAARPGGEERWIETLATVMIENGVPVTMLGLCRDVTHRAKVQGELRIRASQQEAVAKLSERALTENDLQTFFDEAVAKVAEVLRVDLVKILELVPGDAELLLRAGVGVKPGLVGHALVSAGRDSHAGFTLASGGPVVVEDLATETRFTGAWLLHEHNAVSGISAPIAGRDGRAYGVLAAHASSRRKFSEYDLSFLVEIATVIAGAIQRHQLNQRQEMMIRELRHRSGNLFSQLLALFSQTAKSSRSVGELTTKYEARVLALANAHRLITEGGWKSASLMEVLNTLMAPLLERVSFSGPVVFLEPEATFAVSMAVHELTTNAIKHGSLSTRAGRVELSWLVKRTGQGLTLVLDWKEHGGPSPKRQRRAGFGSRLINMVIERQLNGKVEQTFGPRGYTAALVIPLTHQRWLGGTGPAAASAEIADAGPAPATKPPRG